MSGSVLPIFPLGSVLLPHMPLRLQIFEPRYRQMLADMIAAEDLRFGVVLIERGHEVGGGDHRFPAGTVAEIRDLVADGTLIRLAAIGATRFRVREWLPDDPYPRALVDELPDFDWDESLAPELSGAEAAVRRTLRLASEFSDDVWPADVELTADPIATAWQLAAIAPLAALDQLNLLGSPSLAELLAATERLTTERAADFG